MSARAVRRPLMDGRRRWTVAEKLRIVVETARVVEHQGTIGRLLN